jgi:monovalent cation:H+ antiporter-2, CPA2 family
MHILQDIVIILFSAIVIILISSRFRIPSVVGFLLTGMIIGPYAAGFIKNTHDIEIFAEIGIVLMMFIIGIEFSVKKLHRIRKLIVVAGGGQVIITILVIAGLALLQGYEYNTAIFFGFLVSLSSTAIVLKLLQDRRQLDSPPGKIELGVLLFQDLCVVPMVVFTPILGLGLSGGNDTSGALLEIGIAVVVINVVFFALWYLMPYILHAVVKTRLKEIFIIASLFMCLGMAALTNYLGLSLALGAFLAGLIISESKYSHQVVADILPFKEAFNSVFFISIGMLLDFGFVFGNTAEVLSMGVSIFFIKAIIVFTLVLLLKYPLRVAVIAGFGLAQVGEFSFILAKLGISNGLISDEIFQSFLASSIFTMIITPFVFNLSPIAARQIERGRIFRPLKKLEKSRGNQSTRDGDDEDQKEDLKNHTIIVGYGLNGRNLARVLRSRKISYVIIELNPDSVKEATLKNETIVYGDATKRHILEEAGIKTAKVITFAISDTLVIDHAVATARFLNKEVYIIARTKYVLDIDRLYELGADTVFSEEYETSLEILARVMMLYGLSKEAVNRELNELHKQRYAQIRDKNAEERIQDKIHQAIHEEVNIDSFTITKNCCGEKKTIAELDIRQHSGATIISIVRGNEQFSNPGADFVLQAGDVVVLMGSAEQVEKAVELLG